MNIFSRGYKGKNYIIKKKLVQKISSSQTTNNQHSKVYYDDLQI